MGVKTKGGKRGGKRGGKHSTMKLKGGKRRVRSGTKHRGGNHNQGSRLNIGHPVAK